MDTVTLTARIKFTFALGADMRLVPGRRLGAWRLWRRRCQRPLTEPDSRLGIKEHDEKG